MYRKILWCLLIIFVSFDNIYSYIAIVYHGMREANPVTAFFVNISPLYYFISIPLTLLVLYAIVKLIGWLARKEKPKELRNEVEDIFLTSITIAWVVTITLFNLITFLNSFSTPRIDYRIFLVTGISIAVIFALSMDYRLMKRYRKSFWKW